MEEMSYRRFRMSGYYTSGRKVHPVAGPAMKYAGRMFRAAITTANVTGGIAPTVAAGPISFAGYVRAFCVALGRLPTHWSKDRASTATRRWNTRKATTKVTSRPSRCTALALSLPWRRWATTLKSGTPPQTTHAPPQRSRQRQTPEVRRSPIRIIWLETRISRFTALEILLTTIPKLPNEALSNLLDALPDSEENETAFHNFIVSDDRESDRPFSIHDLPF